jgi:predicted metal-binding membrane protein
MMAPSAAPMILMYARMGRQAAVAGTPLAATGWFAAGYFLAWIGFSVLATIVQWALERAALLDTAMASASNVLGGIVLIGTGVYQWTPLKDVCLRQCQTPLLFLMRHGGFRGEMPGCLLLGLRHGAYCVGCCWVLMTLLFVGGVMNVLWIAVLALLVLQEKLTPIGRVISAPPVWPSCQQEPGCCCWERLEGGQGRAFGSGHGPRVGRKAGWSSDSYRTLSVRRSLEVRP